MYIPVIRKILGDLERLLEETESNMADVQRMDPPPGEEQNYEDAALLLRIQAAGLVDKFCTQMQDLNETLTKLIEAEEGLLILIGHNFDPQPLIQRTASLQH